MIPILYSNSETSFDNNGIGSLCDATSCIVTEERNGLYEIELSYPINGALFRYLQEGCYVKAKPNETSLPQLFHIYSSSKPMNGIVTFYGEHISYELIVQVCFLAPWGPTIQICIFLCASFFVPSFNLTILYIFLQGAF